jgi:hypothetical protein
MTEVEKLLAIEEIKALMARRLRCMDTKDWALYDTCHADDATVSSFANIPDEHRPPGAVARGKAEIMASVRKVVDRLTTVHHAHTPEIEITSPTTAKGVWAMEDLLSWQNGEVLEQLRGFGHYHETYVKVGGRWLIQSRVLTRLRLDETPGFHRYHES